MYSQEYKDTVQLFHDAIAFRKPKRTPHMSGFFTWKIHDSEFSFREALYDNKKMEKLVCDFHERYNFDAYIDLGTRNPMALCDAMGPGRIYTFDDKVDSIYVTDKAVMEGTEYSEYAKDPKAFARIMFARKYPEANALNMLEGMNQLIKFGQFSGAIAKKFIDKYSRPSVFSMTGANMMPPEFFCSSVRGLKNYSMDMRRHGAALLEAQDAYFETYTKPAIQKTLASDNSIYVTDCYTALLAYSMMSPKQFEKFYWPYLKYYIDETIKANKTIYIYCESSMMRFADFFADYPKGHIIIHPEADSVFDVRAKLPNVCVSGGMPTSMLGNGTPEECVAMAKKLIDEMGPGFILSQDKMVSFKNDCRRENMLAVCEFVRNYQP